MGTLLIGVVIGSVVTLVAQPLVRILWVKVVNKTENIKL